MTIREALARWLCPDLARRADRYEFLISATSQAYRWLGDYPDAEAMAQWLLERDADHWRPLSAAARGKLPHDIAMFRDRLHRRKTEALAALKLAVLHIEHMAAWISKQNAGYCFEALGEDMSDIRSPLNEAEGRT